MANENLQAAKAAKKDEFYTQLTDIEKELRHYKEHFRGKTVLCNCDDPRVSNFFRYFQLNFEHLGLKRLITTCYKSQEVDLFSQQNSEKAVYLIYDGDKNGNRALDPEELQVMPLKGDGDFRSPECVELLKQADIVVTNPPFSLFREYVALLMQYEKKFLIIGNQNAITYKEIFPLIMNNKMWLGYHSGHTLFAVPDDYEVPDFYDISDKKRLSSNGYKFDENGKLWRNLGNICWYTNLDIQKRHEEMILYKSYSPEEYPKYDNCDAIEACPCENIPSDYYGKMGVPITWIEKYCPTQFEILGITKTWFGFASKVYGEQVQVDKNGKTSKVTKLNDGPVLKLDSIPSGATYYKVGDEIFTQLYARILIRRKQ